MALQVMGLPSVDDMMIDQRKRISKQASNEYNTTLGSLEIRSDRQVCIKKRLATRRNKNISHKKRYTVGPFHCQ